MVAFANLDMYRKIPVELLESTKRGSVMSIVSLLVMTTLVALETKTFLTSTTVTDLKLDTSNKERVSRVSFNITFMDLKCKFTLFCFNTFLKYCINNTWLFLFVLYMYSNPIYIYIYICVCLYIVFSITTR